MAKTKTAPEPATAAGDQEPKRSKKKVVLAGVLAGLLLGGAVYAFLLKGDDAGASEVPVPPEEGEIVDVAELTVNVAGGSIHYARVGFAVVLSADASADAVTPDLPLLKDAAISEVSRFTADELRTPAGGDALRDALTTRARELWPDGEILRVVLTSLVVQ